MSPETKELIWDVNENIIVRSIVVALWLILSIYLVAMTNWSKNIQDQRQIESVILIVISILTTLNFMIKNRWLRYISFPSSIFLTLYCVGFAIAVPYPFMINWWIFPVGALLGGWTLLTASAGFNKKAG